MKIEINNQIEGCQPYASKHIGKSIKASAQSKTTSVTAIIGLTAAMIWNIVWLDALGAIISSFVIIKWSIGLLKDSGKVLLDIHSSNHEQHQ